MRNQASAQLAVEAAITAVSAQSGRKFSFQRNLRIQRHHLSVGAALALSVVVTAAVYSPATAQTWTGNASNDWTTPGNWSGGAVPTNGTVTISTTSPNHTVLGVAGAAVATSGGLIVGNAASGSLTIQNGGTLTSTATIFSNIGTNGGTGVVNVTGPLSRWNYTGTPGLVSVVLGNFSGTGTLNVSDGGSVVTAGDLVVGERQGGTGFLSIMSGGTVSTGRDAYIARRIAGTSQGTATVSGTGSSWTIAARLFVANGGTGALTIADNARVTVATATTVVDSGGTGTLNISGGGVLETPSLTRGLGSAQVNFDGGVLQATANNANFITGFGGTQLNLATGGLTINTAGFNVGTDAASALTGVGGLTKTGAGTLSLAANNTYAGETLIQMGTLALTGAGSIANSSRVVANTTFDISALTGAGTNIRSLSGSGTVALGTKTLTLTNANDTFSGVIGGAGALALSGGTQILTGTNTYGGGTTISAGTLQLGAGGTTGSILGPIVDNGTLAISRSNAVTLSGDISGSGTLAQIGTGTTTLTGTNTYSGGTTISAGTLQIGASGATGSVVGNVLNNGTLTFNRAGTLTLDGLISGTGAVNQIGSGVTVLTGGNTYTGPTTISAGTLIVDGNQSGATGLTTVANGGTLGGNGVIGGSVTIADGILAPGGVGNDPGTLTIQQDLSLGAASVLNYNFGQANVAGAPYNDLTVVNGNLVLDGTLNVTVTPGRTFGPGVYRVIEYSGTLTNNTLATGVIPSPDHFVQTSVANQVNLVNTAGLTLNYWDGVAGPKNNGAINGGNGVWQNPVGNDNWTELTGVVNAPWTDSAFAIFQASGGNVTVDNSLGQVAAFGMQFAADGYHLFGGPIDLTGGATSIIRVGNGTSSGAGYVATIDNELTGNTQLVKTDLGTLVLGGLNTYTGGTTVQDGTLQISSDANLGDAAGGVTLDGGTLRTTTNIASSRAFDVPSVGTILTDAGTILTLNGSLSGAGDLVKDGDGTLFLNSAAANTGLTTLTNGTLRAGGTGVFSAASDFIVQGGGTLDLAGFDQTVAQLDNAGIVNLGGAPGTELTISGNYIGSGGVFNLNATLGGDASPTDRVVIGGGTSGSSLLRVTNAGGIGAPTSEGIKLVEVTGASNGSFALIGQYVFQGQQAVVGGAYAYTLQQNGISTPADGDWYLRSTMINAPTVPIFQPGVALYESYPQILLNLISMPTLRDRVGDRYRGGPGTGAGNRAAVNGDDDVRYLGGPSSNAYAEPTTRENGQAWWGRVDASHISVEPSASTASASFNADQVRLQSGLDAKLYEGTGGKLMGGLTVQHGSSWATVNSIWGDGKIDIDGYGLGATLTWYGLNGLYVDGQAQVHWLDTDMRSSLAGSLIEGDSAEGYGLSLETGRRFSAGGPWAFVPQAQLAYTRADFDFTDTFDATVAARDGDSLLGRLGLALDYLDAWTGGGGPTRSNLYGIANVYYEFLDATPVDVAGTRFISERDELWGGLGVGGTYSWNSDKYALYSEVSVNTSLENFGDSYSVNGTGGFRIRW